MAVEPLSSRSACRVFDQFVAFLRRRGYTQDHPAELRGFRIYTDLGIHDTEIVAFAPASNPDHTRFSFLYCRSEGPVFLCIAHELDQDDDVRHQRLRDEYESLYAMLTDTTSRLQVILDFHNALSYVL